MRNINRVTLIPTSDGQILASFDVTTFEISKPVAESVKSNMQSSFNKQDILSDFKSIDTVFEFKSITTGAYIINGRFA